MLDLDWVRRRFPPLLSEWALFDNAGGSVPLTAVVDRVAEHLRRFAVQVGATYEVSREAGSRVEAGHRAVERWIGAEPGEVILGASTTLNLQAVARALRPLWQEGDEVVITDLDHEANRGAWLRLAESGIRVRTWRLRPETAALELDDLAPLLSGRTRLVAMTHCSNLVGRIHDVPAAAALVHEAGALLCVDGVAFAPHRRVDVRTLGADLYAFSTYKTFGPHLGVLWGRRELLDRVASQNHAFLPDSPPGKLEPGGANYELASALPAILEYLEALDVHHGGDPADPLSFRLDRAYARIAAHEETLATPLLEFLGGRPDVRIVGPADTDARVRVPTVSFAVDGRRASSIPPRLDDRRIAIRWGHFYAYEAVRALGLADADGVVRVSMVHTNTPDEVARMVSALDAVL